MFHETTELASASVSISLINNTHTLCGLHKPDMNIPRFPYTILIWKEIHTKKIFVIVFILNY
jgi:hypothetical protein